MRLLLLTGKGGVGKTTVAAATAVHAARRGTKTLVLSTDSAHSLGDALGVPLAGRPTEVETGLSAQQVDVRPTLDGTWAHVQGYLARLLDAAGVDGLAAHELTVAPGIEEVLALLEVRDQVRQGPWDLVVVDCAPTADALRLLSLPEALTGYLDRLLPAERRLLAGLRRPVRAGGRPGRLPAPGDAVVQALTRLHAGLLDVREVLTDPAATVRLVLTPEAVVLAEARRSLTALAMLGYRVDAVVANRLVPPGDDPWRARWAATQSDRLTGLAADVAPVPVLAAPYLDREPIGADALAGLAAHLLGDDHDPVAVPDLPAPMRVHRTDGDLVLDLALPLVAGGDVDLRRRGDDLEVAVGAHRRLLSLPSALRRCDVVGATLRDGRLLVRFRPDPDLWRPL